MCLKHTPKLVNTNLINDSLDLNLNEETGTYMCLILSLTLFGIPVEKINKSSDETPFIKKYKK